MSQAHYRFDSEACFVIEQYNDCPPFASFLPGMAGIHGHPAWVFYVNRGQAIASLGVRNKDGAFLEFFPADKAYQLTASRGFRTFLKITEEGQNTQNYEPFQRHDNPQVRQRLYIAAHEVSVEEDNPGLGLRIRVDMYTLPDAPVAGLVRRVELTNTSKRSKTIKLVDGLPQVLPYGLNQWLVKFMSRTSEAFMRMEGVAVNLPFYRLKTWPTDTPQVEPIIAGHFFFGLLNGRRTRVVVDPEQIFGLAGDFSMPERFYSMEAVDFADQVQGNQTPAAFQALTLALQPGTSQVFYGIYGHASTYDMLEQFSDQAGRSDYLEHKRQQNRSLLENITQKAFTATAKPLFDAHIRQSYLDNGLRGGFSMPVPGGVRLHLFGRKHGDLERDYNDFLLQDTPFSEGNGDFRDMLQNRRMDVFFDPALQDKNIRYFFNLIQPDGYNPCSLRNSRFIVANPAQFAPCFSRFPALEALLSQEFKYAQLWQTLGSTLDHADIIQNILAQATEVEDAEFDRGYWSDHWTYLIDLLIAYTALFPDRLGALFQNQTYSFFDPTHSIAPRSEKYRLTPTGVMQLGAVQFNPDKKNLIESRSQRRYQVRSQYGHGEIVYTSLLGKILTLVVNKLATLDPYGVGIEMEADRPGWCDALNGLPGILGSSVNETIELKRLVDFTLQALPALDQPLTLPAELASFLHALQTLLQANLTADSFWRDSGAEKESYRTRVFMGFSGQTQTLPITSIKDFLSSVSSFLDKAIDKAKTADGIVSYFAYQAEQYQELGENKVNVQRFRQQPLPLFLEGFVHALRIAQTDEAQRLYEAAQRSELFDKKLGMYRINVPLGDNALALGRIGVFNYGWLENGSIFLHMHYKFVLEMVRAGLIGQFYQNIDRLLVAFRDPAEYKRNPIENSSFLVSSGFSLDERQHGRGCVARLSGATVELLHLWTHLFLGPQPFVLADEQLQFRPAPALPGEFFTSAAQTIKLLGHSESLPANSAACALLGSSLLVYINPRRLDSFGPAPARPCAFTLYDRHGSVQTLQGNHLPGALAEAVRAGTFRRLDVLLDGL